jgi:UDP-glucose 4-epimerase
MALGAEDAVNCLVLGGGGFIGSHLAEALARAGHRVTVFDRPQGRYLPLLKGCEVRTGDFLEPRELEPALRGAELVFHMISTTVPRSSNDDPRADVSANVVGTLRLLELCKAHGVRRVVFPSSGGTVYGIPRATPVGEAHPTDPISSYGIHKLTIEKYLHLHHVLEGLDYHVLRIANAYGERQRTDTAQGAVAVFLERALRGEPIRIWGDGSVVRDYVYVGDIAQAFLRTLEHEGEPRIFNIGSGQGASLNQLIDEIARTLGRRPAVEYTPARRFDVPVNVLDASLARKHLGWAATTPLAEGIRRTHEWMKKAA